jgi:hypothetical protein
VNRWNIPDCLEREVIARNRACIYCGASFDPPGAARRCRPSREHIVNDARIVARENIARCCIGCNASKGAKPLVIWLGSNYYMTRGITAETIAPVARAAIEAAGDSGQ